MQQNITEAYTSLVHEYNVTVVSVGQVWAKALELRPGLNLYGSDGSHLTSLGTYLTSCIFYSALTGNTALGLPREFKSKDSRGKDSYYNIQSEEDAAFCQMVSELMMSNFIMVGK